MKTDDPIAEFGAELRRRWPYDPRFKSDEGLKSFLDQVFGSDGLGKPPDDTGNTDRSRTSDEEKVLMSNSDWMKTKRL